MERRHQLLIALAVAAFVAAIWSFVLLHNPVQQTLDQRVQNVASQLKCPVCQGESVASSQATIALQMRGVIRQQLQDGRSEQEVIQYFQASYGDSIMWSPPWQGFTLLAWLVPIALLLGGAILLFFVLREWRSLPPGGAIAGDAELAQIDEAELAAYRAELERELAEDDPTFSRRSGMEAY
jgi:cytochrome c-type biogenesis protein CcmH